jgi:hypothetical protein
MVATLGIWPYVTCWLRCSGSPGMRNCSPLRLIARTTANARSTRWSGKAAGCTSISAPVERTRRADSSCPRVRVRTCGSVTSAPDASAPADLVFVPFVGGESGGGGAGCECLRFGRTALELRGGRAGGRRLGCVRAGDERSGRPGGLRPSAVRSHRQRPLRAQPSAVGVHATVVADPIRNRAPRLRERRGWRPA